MDGLVDLLEWVTGKYSKGSVACLVKKKAIL